MTIFLLVVAAVAAVTAVAAAVVVLRELRTVRSELGDAVSTLREHNQKQHRGTRAVVDALSSLAGLGPAGTTTPSTQGWSASPMVLRQLAEQVTEHRPELVVELGGGGSSVLLGRLLRDQGRGRVVSIEHDPTYGEVTRAHLRRHGLEDVVEIRIAPLVPVEVDGQTYQWYDPAAFADLAGIDLVFVDGPPRRTGRHARFPAVPVLAPRCAPGARVLLDDGGRPQERQAADRWIADHGATEVHSDDVGTGWILLSLR